VTTWAIGDVHACLGDLDRLIERIGFDPARDRLWFVGDLVNRGPDSAATLRRVRDLGAAAVCVLGNHDLHLLATAQGARARAKDTFDDVFAATDRDELLDWLRHRPLLHHDAELGFTLVHAGLHPAWDLATAQRLAGELEALLRTPGAGGLFDYMYGDDPAAWSAALPAEERRRFAINAFTRMRYCDAEGRLDMDVSCAPGEQPAGLIPWFDYPGRRNRGLRIVFGHWSTLGYLQRAGVHGLDSGCLWGGCLTALCLDDPAHRVAVDCAGGQQPG